MADIFDEVSEELRQDQIKNLLPLPSELVKSVISY